MIRSGKTVTVAVTVKNTAKTPLENYFVAVASLPRDLDLHKARLAGGVALKERKASRPAIGNGVAVWSLPSIPAKKTVRVILNFDTPVSSCISANATAPTNLTFVAEAYQVEANEVECLSRSPPLVAQVRASLSSQDKRG